MGAHAVGCGRLLTGSSRPPDSPRGALVSRKIRFNDQVVERLKAPKSGREEWYDSLCPGLVIRITERGVKSFSCQYRVAGEGGTSATGRQRQGGYHRITLGQTPPLDLKQARE